MAEGAHLRVALLARAGSARDHLRQALADLGAALVVEADPNDVPADALQDAGVTTVLVSVEPAVEDAIDRLDEALQAPGLTVMFDEAETTAKLSGWDQARWARHVAAKLLGRDVLPPGAEVETVVEAAQHLVPGAPSTPASLSASADITDFAEEIEASAGNVPSGDRLPEPVPIDAAQAPAGASSSPSASWATPPALPEDPDALGLDLGALEQAMAGLADAPVEQDEAIDLTGLELIDDAGEAAEPAAPPPRAGVSLLAAKEIDLGGFTPAEEGTLEVEEISLTEAELAAFGEGMAATPSASSRRDDDPEAEAGEGIDMDPELARLAAAFDENLDALSFEPVADDPAEALSFDAPAALEVPTPRSASEPPPIPDFDFDDAPMAPAAPAPALAVPDTSHFSLSEADDAAPAAPTAPKPAFDFGALGGLELAPLDDAPAVSAPAPTPPPAMPDMDLGHLSLTPVGEGEGGAPAEAQATLLVLSGIGGPDAVRQLLRALPAAFPLAVLLKQDLDGGRHDRFVEQLAKISRLPVALAEGHETPPANAVRVLPEGLGGVGALVFAAERGPAGLVEAVSARQGAIVVLSGASPEVVEPVREAMAQGLHVLVQEPSSCFDGKAAEALKGAGATALSAGDLAARLDAFFPS